MIINDLPEEVWLEHSLMSEGSRWIFPTRFYLWVAPEAELISECLLIDGKYYAQCVMKEKWIYERPCFIILDHVLWIDPEDEDRFEDTDNPIYFGIDKFGRPYYV